ncbi:hypothetical protein [Hugenholtzia roseola]|uniref:hypothetical protein n=1 Tax=Hugenholtzia roseola TaxID=1002 RepID=UPI0004247B07|nr:hypothetical protein [Hugenholtzia roseola]
MYKFLFLVLLITLSYSNPLSAQDKFEKESRIKEKDVPSLALQFVDSLPLQTKIKWYKEEGLTQNSIEAKFKHQEKNYSIEFDTLGQIEDIEIEIAWAKVETAVSKAILEQIETDCAAHKIIKAQQQFSGKTQDLFSLFQTKSDNFSSNLTTKYEIVVKCKSQKEISLFEYLFDEKGNFLNKSKIIFKNSSHLEY